MPLRVCVSPTLPHRLLLFRAGLIEGWDSRGCSNMPDTLEEAMEAAARAFGGESTSAHWPLQRDGHSCGLWCVWAADAVGTALQQEQQQQQQRRRRRQRRQQGGSAAPRPSLRDIIADAARTQGAERHVFASGLRASLHDELHAAMGQYGLDQAGLLMLRRHDCLSQLESEWARQEGMREQLHIFADDGPDVRKLKEAKQEVRLCPGWGAGQDALA